jgi:UDP-4-amino-4,6-dideoxy-N-acetyl-beta-L-altrosamine N-acetyltransferase
MLFNEKSPGVPWPGLANGPVRLRPLKYHDIEKVRSWRNDPEVAQFMVYRELITKEQQEEWFHRIQKEKGFYAIIVVNGVDIGLADLKNFSADGKSAEGGIFVHSKEFQNSIYGYAVSILFLDFAFEKLNLELVEAKIVDKNVRAIRFNESLGYVRDGRDFAVGVGRYLLTAERYKKKVVAIRRALVISLEQNP